MESMGEKYWRELFRTGRSNAIENCVITNVSGLCVFLKTEIFLRRKQNNEHGERERERITNIINSNGKRLRTRKSKKRERVSEITQEHKSDQISENNQEPRLRKLVDRKCIHVLKTYMSFHIDII